MIGQVRRQAGFLPTTRIDASNRDGASTMETGAFSRLPVRPARRVGRRISSTAAGATARRVLDAVHGLEAVFRR
jgi:vacuolar-type H+-ATPase catalytic subunit A/Vma1